MVLVATHAMGSLDRADALCVLVGGHVAYFGPPKEALAYFRVDRYAELFHQLEKQSPSAWRLTARADPIQRLFLRRAGAVSRSGAETGQPEEQPSAVDVALDRMKERLRRPERS
jgi:ABC-type multidrug transport system ATPase subunit